MSEPYSPCVFPNGKHRLIQNSAAIQLSSVFGWWTNLKGLRRSVLAHVACLCACKLFVVITSGRKHVIYIWCLTNKIDSRVSYFCPILGTVAFNFGQTAVRGNNRTLKLPHIIILLQQERSQCYTTVGLRANSGWTFTLQKCNCTVEHCQTKARSWDDDVDMFYDLPSYNWDGKLDQVRKVLSKSCKQSPPCSKLDGPQTLCLIFSWKKCPISSSIGCVSIWLR